MKQYMVCSIALILLASCKSNGVKEIEREPPRPAVPRCVAEAFNYYVEHQESDDTSIIYKMSFLNGIPGPAMQDTVILFCMMRDGWCEEGLRGIIRIGNYRVLVYDEKRVGEWFYNVDFLQTVDFNSLTLPKPKDIIVCFSFILDGGKYMKLWEDFEDYSPIVIDGRSDEPHL